MNTHPYLRAFLAGIFVPTLVLPVMLVGFITLRLVLAVPVPIERFIIFPMAIVPSLFGLWNVLYLATHERTHMALGAHGAILPFLGAPTGAFVALGCCRLAHTVSCGFRCARSPMHFSSPFLRRRWRGTTWFGSTLWGS